MKFEHTEVFNFEGAIRGMRNPKESWKLSDSRFCTSNGCAYCGYDNCDNNDWYEDDFSIGKKDLELMQKLILAGSEHRKFMRQIFVSVDITAPMYFFSEFDTYKVGTVANSTSKMHKLASTPITMDCFEMDDFSNIPIPNTFTSIGEYYTNSLIPILESLRQEYNKTKDKQIWKELIRLLPESWLQTRTVTMNYENLRSMVFQRKNHKLTEWSVSFIEWVKTLPYAEELIFIEKKDDNK